MIEFPKISIVTVNYNGAEYLERTINSVLGQRYPNLEYIIIDGGSKDGSVDIIRKYELQLTYWVSEPDKGMYDALQHGLQKTTGQIMGWINSDDLYHQNAFFQLSEIFKNYPQINWLTGVPTALDEADNIMIPKVDEYPMWSKQRFYSSDYKWIQQESTLWRRSLWIKAGGSLDTNLKFAGDFHLWLQFFKYEKLYVAPVLIGGFRMRKSGQKSVENLDSYLNEVKTCFKKEVSFVNYFLLPLIVIDRIIVSIPVITRWYYRFGFRSLLGYPPKMEFDPKTQKIVIK